VKSTGVVRKIDPLGRIVIPVELRRGLGWDDGQALEVFVGDDGEVILRAYRPGCVGCGGFDGLVQLRPGVMICRHCAGRALEEERPERA
jgi:transcriptional pleiotropic regulator of transition state genes